MTLKRILAICLLAGLLPAIGSAQTETVETGVVVNTTPPGAQITLDGEATVSGVAPVHFRQLLIGDYRLKVEKRGWETYSTNVILDPGKQMNVNISLSPKTRTKAAARSLFIPGWGQRYSGHKGKGALMFLAALGAGTAYLIADNDFDDKNEQYDARLAEYDSLAAYGASTELTNAWNRLASAQDEAYDAENIRRVTIGVAIGIWAINMLDILFFFPDERGTFSVKGIAVEPSATTKQVGLTISKNF